MRIELLNPGHALWLGLLGRVRHQFYQEPAYVVLEAARTRGRAAALYVEDKGRTLLIPLVLSQIKIGEKSPVVFDGISPYGYPGFLVDAGDQSKAFMKEALAAAVPFLGDQEGLTSLFLRLDPLFNDPDCLEGLGTLVEHGACVYIDLQLSEEELRRHVRSRFRSYLRAMERDGVTARFDDSFESLDIFIDFYYRTMKAVGASELYFFDRSYFSSLKEALGPDLKLCIVEHQGNPVAAGLFAASGGVVQYLFSGKDEGGGHPHATKLMMVFLRDWARKEGYEAMHFGGGVGGEPGDPLSRFKRGFSKLSKPFFSWRLVVHPERFSKALESWEKQGGERAGDAGGFFPPYRKPIEVDQSEGDQSSGQDVR